MEPSDSELLAEFASEKSDAAFGALVERHAAMVHGVALRILGNGELAEEATQAVFIVLARKAARLSSRTVLAGWLFRAARLVALESLRAERRREQRHQAMARMKEENQSAPSWKEIAPLLEEQIQRLGEADRAAIILRYLEDRPISEVARELGTTEAAVKMRLSRALEKLRLGFARRGLATSAAGCAAALAGHGAETFPAGLPALLTSAALTQTPMKTSSQWLIRKTLTDLFWNKWRPWAIGFACVILTATVVWHGLAHFRQVEEVHLGALAGEWEGTYLARGDFAPIQQPVALSVTVTPDGRSCQIDMDLFDANGEVVKSYQFTHALTADGRHLDTQDDPQLGRMTRQATITEAGQDRPRGEWWLKVRLPDDSATCSWARRGDLLRIVRKEKLQMDGGLRTFISELNLHPRLASSEQFKTM